jgi:hypothetical protein
MGETLNKSIQKSTDLQDPFLKYLSLEIGKLERHQERVSGFETAIRLEVTLRDKWKTRAKNYGQLKKGINIDYDNDEEALAGLHYKKELKNHEELVLHSLQQRLICKVEQELFTFSGFSNVK